MEPNECQNYPNTRLYDEFVGIYSDLKVFLFALHHANQMPETDRNELPFTGNRILDRLEIAIEDPQLLIRTHTAQAQQSA